MVSTTHVIMTVHPVLVLMPILGLFVLPCAPTNSVNGLTVVANLTVENPGDCGIELCPQNKVCTQALYKEKSRCFLISCSNNTQNSSCGNVTNFNDLLAEQSVSPTELVHVIKNQTDESAPVNQTSVTISSQSSSNITQPSAPNTTVSVSTISTTPPVLQSNLTAATPDLQTTTTQKPATSDAVPKPATNITTPMPAGTFSATTKPTTTTSVNSPTTTSTTTTSTTTSTTVAQTTKQPSSPSPSGTNSPTDTSPSVPTIPPSIPSTKPLQTSPIPTSPIEKTSTVAHTLPKDIPKGGKAIVEVAGDPLTSHLLNTSSLLAVLLFGLLFFVVAVAVFVKQAYESYRRKDYTQVDYLINGMYADSGV